MTIRIATMPRLRLFVNDRESESLNNRRKSAALLLYLALERSVTRDAVLNLFWPDSLDQHARHNLSQLMYETRQDIGEDWVDSRGGTLVVRSTVETDIAGFEKAINERRYGEALELYGGGMLEGVHLVATPGFEHWLDLRRAQIGRWHRKARREAIVQRLQEGNLAAALNTAVQWSEFEPNDDEAQQHTIELLARTGRRTEAVRQFELFEEALRREDLEPLPELRSLIAAIRGGTFGSASANSSIPLESVQQSEDSTARLPADLTLIRLIAEGAAARVYLAREAALSRVVAVKVLTPRSMRDSTAVRRFEREAKAVARIQHPNVTPIFRVGILADGAPYLVLPFVGGGSLEDRLTSAGSIGDGEARRIISQIAAGLAAAHRMGIVHRDLRPANVLYDRDADRVMITDFGAAALLDAGDPEGMALTRPGERLGVPAYSSPEQLRGEPVSDRSDVYSLGVVAFELLTGELPFKANTPVEMATAHFAAIPPPLSALKPDIDPNLDRLIGRCLNKRPEQRPFAGDIANALTP